MVYLSRIYTKTGDDGSTELGDRQRRPKDDPRVAAYGDVDELNSVLGVAVSHAGSFRETGLLASIQNDLFDVGADLCVPESEDGTQRLRVTPEQILRLEGAIDRINLELKPLTSFVLPGGTVLAAALHQARTVCRRAERVVVTLARTESVNSNVLVYLNRLSDLLFVLARIANQLGGESDILWAPGQSRDGTA